MPDQEFEIVVVGAGPAGIAAACTAAECGKRVVLIDENPAPGGQIWRAEQNTWTQRLAASGCSVRPNSSVIDQPETGVLRIASGNISYQLRFKHLVIATGARERYLPFPGWTLPGVCGAGGLQALAKSGWPVNGKRIVVAGTGPLLLAVAAYLHKRGAHITCIAEQAPRSRVMMFALQSGKLLQGAGLQLQLLGVPYRFNCWPTAAMGKEQLEAVTLCQGDHEWTEQCDYLACGFGLVPNVELAALLGCQLHRGAVKADEYQQTTVPGIYCAGEPTGVGGVDLALIQGQVAGLAAAGLPEKARDHFRRRARWVEFRARLDAAFALRDELSRLAVDDTVICRCEDVPLGQIRQHHSWRSAKLHTRCGMGPCQGRVCGPVVEHLLGWPLESVRPPLSPVSIRQLAVTDSDPSTRV
ncbi:MAG: NAD(P)/FAD-dependent oxidoreductase [Bryobacterales bacterium]|nr:NAD(P)/FAD-dependent oxidoreductase [Bryobacterales bacterium]